MTVALERSRSVAIYASALVMLLHGCDKAPKGAADTGGADLAHSTAWYQAHPDAVRADEKRCAGEAPSLSREACQNLYAAENALGVQEMQDAARRNNAAAQQPKSP
jgi:hypothetical protein